MDVNSCGATYKRRIRHQLEMLEKMPLHTGLCARTGHDDCQIGHERTLRHHIENILPSFVSALMMISPFTLRFLRLCRSDENN